MRPRTGGWACGHSDARRRVIAAYPPEWYDRRALAKGRAPIGHSARRSTIIEYQICGDGFVADRVHEALLGDLELGPIIGGQIAN